MGMKSFFGGMIFGGISLGLLPSMLQERIYPRGYALSSEDLSVIMETPDVTFNETVLTTYQAYGPQNVVDVRSAKYDTLRDGFAEVSVKANIMGDDFQTIFYVDNANGEQIASGRCQQKSGCRLYSTQKLTN